MRVTFAVILATLSLGFSVTSGQMPGQKVKQSRFKKGVAQFRETGFDFGKVPQQTSVCKKFYVVNVGTDTLEILDVRPSCGCTKAPITKKLISAGDSTEIEIIFSTGTRMGQYSKSTRVETSDLLNRVADLKISAYVYPVDVPTSPVASDPWVIEMGQGEAPGVVKLKNITTTPLSVRLVYEDGQFGRVSLSGDKIAPGETITATVKPSSGFISKSFRKSFTLEFSDREHTRMTVPVAHGALSEASSQK